MKVLPSVPGPLTLGLGLVEAIGLGRLVRRTEPGPMVPIYIIFKIVNKFLESIN